VWNETSTGEGDSASNGSETPEAKQSKTNQIKWGIDWHSGNRATKKSRLGLCRTEIIPNGLRKTNVIPLLIVNVLSLTFLFRTAYIYATYSTVMF
jgi:hypothetical protein